jgi:tetratricopeptide (TPR) repeat protein
MLKLQLRLARTLILIAALAAGCLQSGSAAWAAGEWTAGANSQSHPDVNRNCPPRNELDATLGKASDLMMQSRYQDAVALLHPLAAKDCDAKVSLLLAAAFDGQGDELKATAVLQRAHSVWPLDNSIAASLAREYLSAGQTDKAVVALNHFHATPSTRPQEMKMAVVAYLIGDKLPSALAVAQVAYKAYPSLDTLLLLANVLQLEGRYPDVNRILESKREAYADSPKFLITIAESESDAKMYAAAQRDLGQAITLTPDSYPAHYVLGNVLVKIGNLDRGLDEYRTAIQLSPQQPRTYYQTGRVLEKMGRSDEAMSWFRKALSTDAQYAPAYCEIGKLEMGANQLQQAAENFNQAIKYNPALPESRYLLIQTYARLGERDKSRAELNQWTAYKKSHQLRPGSIDDNPLIAAADSSPGSASGPE